MPASRTLLKVIAKVLRPSHGRVWVKGHVAPLLEMGAGFHLELTGRENIYLYGSLLGFSRAEMDAKVERIVDFAELRGLHRRAAAHLLDRHGHSARLLDRDRRSA